MLEWRTTNFLQMQYKNQGCCFGLFNQILKPGCTVSKAQLVSLLWEKEKTLWPWEPVNDLTNTYSCTHAHTHTICFETQAHAPTYTLPALHEHTLYISGGKTEIQRPAKKSQRDPVPWGSRGGGGGEDETRDQRSEGWRKEKYSRGIERVTPNQMKRDGEAEIGEGRADKVGAVWEEWCEITGEERSREQRGGSVRNEQVWEEWESHEQQV